MAEHLPSDRFIPSAVTGMLGPQQFSEAVVEAHISHTATLTNWITNGHSALIAITSSAFTFEDGTGDKFLKRWLSVNEFSILSLLVGSVRVACNFQICKLLTMLIL